MNDKVAGRVGLGRAVAAKMDGAAPITPKLPTRFERLGGNVEFIDKVGRRF